MDNSNRPPAKDSANKGSANWIGIVLGIVSAAFFGIISYRLLDRIREKRPVQPFQMRVWVKADGQEREYSVLVGSKDSAGVVRLAVPSEAHRDVVIQGKSLNPQQQETAITPSVAPTILVSLSSTFRPRAFAALLARRLDALGPRPPKADDQTPTALGITAAAIVYPIVEVIEWVNRISTNALDQIKSAIRPIVGLIAWPMRRTRQWADRVFGRFGVYQLIRRYAWAIIPLLVVVAGQLNNHLYYNTFFGYDMPQHFNNMMYIIHTGVMPQPPLGINYEAHQAPLFYVFAAWVAMIGDRLTGNGMNHLIPAALLIASMAWALLCIAVIQRGMRRVHWLWRALTFSVIMLMPVNVLSSVMFNNDLPILALGLLGVMVMWFMVRAGRQLERKMWLRAAAINGLCIAFKNNGVALLGVYILLAAYIAYLYYREQQPDLLAKVLRISALGLPLMIVPFAINAWHTSRYVGNPIGETSAPVSVFYAVRISFFTSFDTSIFDKPFAYGPGEYSYWSLQYVTLHSDYYNKWRSDAYKLWPASAMREDPIMPEENFYVAIVLEYLAIPVTLLMVLGFLYSLYRTVRNPRRGLRDGSIVVVLVTVVAEGAQLVRFVFYASIRDVVIHARYLGFMYPFLLIVGIYWLWQLCLRRHSAFIAALAAFLSVSMMAYSFVALKLLWLPPLF